VNFAVVAYALDIFVALVVLLWVLLRSLTKAPGPVRIWVGGALSAFLDGFIEGLPVGGPAGALVGGVDGQFTTEFTFTRIVIEAAHILAVPIGTGLADVRAFKKSNPVPNIFEPPTSKDVKEPVVSTNP